MPSISEVMINKPSLIPNDPGVIAIKIAKLDIEVKNNDCINVIFIPKI